jgi:sugar lactone lactonase YvrE
MVPHVTSIHPEQAIEGGRIAIHGAGFPVDRPQLPEVRIGGVRARVVFASPTQIAALVPAGMGDGGQQPVRIEGVTVGDAFVDIATAWATGLHQVDNPVFDPDGNLYVTYSGTRGQEVPVSIFRVRPNGTRETFSSGIVNPTSMAIDPEGRLYVSSRFEGTVYRLSADGSAEAFATDLGVACGLAFAADGTLFVGDRSGTIFEVDRRGRTSAMASLPPSVAAYHVALGPDNGLYVTGPTLASYDAVYRVDETGAVSVHSRAFGRPQGLAFDPRGRLHVVEALAGVSGLYRLSGGAAPELVLAAPGLIGVAFDSRGGLVVCTNESAYRLTSRIL